MISPEKVTDDKARSQMFMDACDQIRVAFRMTTSEELYLIGRIFEVTKFEMQEETGKRGTE
ncbi:MAG: hypothetical protein IJI23_07190 [Lachnospiraceae bacterium]|nr:hypothetical protein [Lachnospiraceae bacterium]